MRASVTLVNPLRGTLGYYEGQLVDVLSHTGADVDRFGLHEPSSSGNGRVAWLRGSAAALSAAAARKSDRTLLCWPPAGWFDVIQAAWRFDYPVSVVMHDPRPLVAAIGYDPFSTAVARRLGGRVEVVVHSEAAQDEVLHRPVRHLPHPMFAPRPSATRVRGRPVVTVLGQYKRDRDLEALRQLASENQDHWRLRVLGRGWPPIPGWEVEDAFLSEDDFSECIASSSVVLIPYRRYFQSGVAVRCVELGIPCVGPHDSYLRELLGPVPWLVSESWRGAIEIALDAARDDLLQLAHRCHVRTVRAWGDWVTTSPEVTSARSSQRA